MFEPTDALRLASNTRSLDDRLGEVIYRFRYGLMRPLWADMADDQRETFRDQARPFETLLASCGLRVVIDE